LTVSFDRYFNADLAALSSAHALRQETPRRRATRPPAFGRARSPFFALISFITSSSRSLFAEPTLLHGSSGLPEGMFSGFSWSEKRQVGQYDVSETRWSSAHAKQITRHSAF
jgi:hypothetical protein